MTVKEMRNGGLKVGDFVKLIGGSAESRNTIWVVVKIYEDITRGAGHKLIDIRLVDGTYNDWHTPFAVRTVGFEMSRWSKTVQKIEVIVKEKVE